MVVVQLVAVGQMHHLSLSIDPNDSPMSEVDVGVLPEDRADRVRHICWIKSRRRDLIEQWEEGVEVVLVDQRDVHRLVCQTPGSLNPGESPTDNDYFWHVRLRRRLVVSKGDHVHTSSILREPCRTTTIGLPASECHYPQGLSMRTAVGSRSSIMSAESLGGAGGARTHDRGIMSPLL